MQSIVKLLKEANGEVKQVLAPFGYSTEFSERAKKCGKVAKDMLKLKANVKPVQLISLDSDETTPAVALVDPNEEQLDAFMQAIEDDALLEDVTFIYDNGEAVSMNANGENVTNLGRLIERTGIDSHRDIQRFMYGYADLDAETYYRFSMLQGELDETDFKQEIINETQTTGEAEEA